MGLKEEKKELLAELAEPGADIHRLFKHASDELFDDLEVMSAAVKVDGAAGLRFASHNLKDSEPLVLLAVQSDAKALKHASKRCQGLRKIVLTAVNLDGETLQYASEALREDRDIVLAAVQSNAGAAGALAFAAAHFGNDEQIRKFVESQELESFLELCAKAMSLGVSLRSTLKGMTCTVEAMRAFRRGSPALRSNRRAIQAALPLDPKVLSFVSDPALQSDRALVLEAVQQHGEALMYASPELKADGELQTLASKTFVDVELGCNDPDKLIAAVKFHYFVVMHASKGLIKNPDFLLRAARAADDNWPQQEKILDRCRWYQVLEAHLLNPPEVSLCIDTTSRARSRAHRDETMWGLLKRATRNGLKMPAYKGLLASPLGIPGDAQAPSLMVRLSKSRSSSSSSGHSTIEFETALLSGHELQGHVPMEASLEDLATAVLRLVQAHVKEAKRVVLFIQNQNKPDKEEAQEGTEEAEEEHEGAEGTLLSPFAGSRRLADFLS